MFGGTLGRFFIKRGSVPSHLCQQQMVLVITPERTSHKGDAEHLSGTEQSHNQRAWATLSPGFGISWSRFPSRLVTQKPCQDPVLGQSPSSYTLSLCLGRVSMGGVGAITSSLWGLGKQGISKSLGKTPRACSPCTGRLLLRGQPGRVKGLPVCSTGFSHISQLRATGISRW